MVMGMHEMRMWGFFGGGPFPKPTETYPAPLFKWVIHKTDGGEDTIEARYCTPKPDGTLLLEDMDERNERVPVIEYSVYQWSTVRWGKSGTGFANSYLEALYRHFKNQEKAAKHEIERMEIKDLVIEAWIDPDTDVVRVNVLRPERRTGVTFLASIESLTKLGPEGDYPTVCALTND